MDLTISGSTIEFGLFVNAVISFVLVAAAVYFLVVKPVAKLMALRKFFFSSRRRHTRFDCDWSSDVCSSDLVGLAEKAGRLGAVGQRDPAERQRGGDAGEQAA